VANDLSMSPRYLSDMLKAETGKTAMDHIHLYLIDEAKNLLLDPSNSISETAYELGFEYPQYFSRLFKKKVGISPTAYRDKEGTSYLS
ncbi:MAG: helix-turn-helix transcriptional regulator, partial [Desulfobacterales bacterium]|nr:helix-turn-helix transcriptional regulator [Desulfobacterales bacterium]